MTLLHTSHSKIKEFPPNPITFPKFYQCKEHIYVLNPGDMLYIPSGWFHWVFSYPQPTNIENDQTIPINIALSFNITPNGSKSIYNEFSTKKPFQMTLDKESHPFLKFNWRALKSVLGDKKYAVHKTKGKTIVPIRKTTTDNISLNTMSLHKVEQLALAKTHNASIGQNSIIPHHLGFNPTKDIPTVINNSFPHGEIRPHMWINLYKNSKSYIETRLHYDISHNCLIQIHGTKTVRLYKPSDSPNLYLQPYWPIVQKNSNLDTTENKHITNK